MSYLRSLWLDRIEGWLKLTKGFLLSINLDPAHRMFQHWMELAEISVIRCCLHSLRKTFTSIGFLAGIDSRDMRGVAYWLGDRATARMPAVWQFQRSISA